MLCIPSNSYNYFQRQWQSQHTCACIIILWKYLKTLHVSSIIFFSAFQEKCIQKKIQFYEETEAFKKQHACNFLCWLHPKRLGGMIIAKNSQLHKKRHSFHIVPILMVFWSRMNGWLHVQYTIQSLRLIFFLVMWKVRFLLFFCHPREMQ